MNEPPRRSRRDFLSGRAAAAALGGLLPEPPPEPAPPPPPPAPESYLIQVARMAMACEFEIYLNAGQHPDGPDAALRALDEIARLEDQLSVYRDDSELSRFNRRSGGPPLPVERGLFELLVHAVELSRRTDGAFDVTSGPLSQVWGFSRRQGRLPSDAELQAARRLVGWRLLDLDPDRSTAQLARPGMQINLGAIGKGYALDCAAELLRSAGVGDALLHGGTSSVVALGSRFGAPAERPGWTVALRHPLRPDRRLAEFRLRDRALGTSGAGNQFFFHQGRRLAHVIDPRTGRPAEHLLSATVLAPTAADADALSTAFFVGGPDLAEAYCREHPEVAAVLVPPSPPGSTLTRLVPFNLAPHEWQVYESPDTAPPAVPPAAPSDPSAEPH